MLINCHYGAYPMHYALCTLFVREVSLGKFTKMCTLPSFSHSLSNLFSFFSPGIPLVITTKNLNKYFIISKVFVTMEGKVYLDFSFANIFFSKFDKISPFSDPPVRRSKNVQTKSSTTGLAGLSGWTEWEGPVDWEGTS